MKRKLLENFWRFWLSLCPQNEKSYFVVRHLRYLMFSFHAMNIVTRNIWLLFFCESKNLFNKNNSATISAKGKFEGRIKACASLFLETQRNVNVDNAVTCSNASQTKMTQIQALHQFERTNTQNVNNTDFLTMGPIASAMNFCRLPFMMCCRSGCISTSWGMGGREPCTPCNKISNVFN